MTESRTWQHIAAALHAGCEAEWDRRDDGSDISMHGIEAHRESAERVVAAIAPLRRALEEAIAETWCPPRRPDGQWCMQHHRRMVASSRDCEMVAAWRAALEALEAE